MPLLLQSNISRLIFFILLFAGAIWMQGVYDTNTPQKTISAVTTLPPQVIESVDLGLNSATASFLWIKFIQDFASPEGLRNIAPAIHTIIAVDPHFSYPYAFGVLMIPAFNASYAPEGIAIGQEGVALHLPDYEIPYYLAVMYDLNLKDPTDAALYFGVTANTPGVPDGIRLTSLTFNTRADQLDQAKQIWTSIAQNSNDEIVQDQAQAQLTHINDLQTLDQAIATYKKEKGVYPKILFDLVNAKILPSIPVDPFGIMYGIDASGTLTTTLPAK